MAWTMDLGPLVGLQKRMWRASFFTGLAVYLQTLNNADSEGGRA